MKSIRQRSIASRSLCGGAIAALSMFSGAQAQNSAPNVETVTVTGTNIRGAGPTGSNLITVDRNAIEASGAVTVQNLLSEVPGLNNFGGAGQGTVNSADGSGSQSPTIHNLGNSASNGTLILVDGHRLPYTGVAHSTIDPSSVPVIALQQVQVLPDGASATYGSDAVAGVLNFITRKNFTGAEFDAQYGMADGYNSFSAGGIFGHDWSGGSALLAYQYSNKSQLANGARSYETARQDLRLGVLTNPAAISSTISTTAPAGFLAVTPDNTHGTSGPFGVTVPYPAAGTNFQTFNCPIATIQAANATTSFLYPYTAATGVTNNLQKPGGSQFSLNGVCDNANVGTDLPSETRNIVFAAFRQNITDNLTVNATIDYSYRMSGSIAPRGTASNITVFGPGAATVTTTNTIARGTPTAFSPTTGLPTASLATGGQINPFYTVGTTGLSTTTTQISYDFEQLLAGQPKPLQKTGDETAYATVGLDWDMGNDWVTSLGMTYGTDYAYTRNSHGLCGACVDLALNGTGRADGAVATGVTTSVASDPQALGTVYGEVRALTTANALDVWDPVATNKTSQAVLTQISSQNQNTTGKQDIQDITLKVDGALFQLPAGPLKTAVGGEFIHTTMLQGFNTPSTSATNGGLGPSGVATQTFSLPFGRTVYAIYAEFLVPLVSPEMNIPLIQKLDVDVSGRWDHYTVFGDTENPKIGFTWQIIDGLQGRGSFGTSFTVPAFSSAGQAGTGLTSQSSIAQGGTPNFNVLFNDTTYNGGAGLAGTWVANAASCEAGKGQPVDAGGNNVTAASGLAVGCKINSTNNPGLSIGGGGGRPGIKPELGRTYSAGFDFDFGKMFDALDGLSGEVTYYQATYQGLVTNINLQTAQHGLTFFAPVGGWAPNDPAVTANFRNLPITSALPATVWSYFLGAQTNAYSLWANGLDYSINYSFDSDIGTWRAGISGNEILRFTQRFNGTTALLDLKNGKQGNAGRFAAQEMTWRANLGWNMNPYSASLGFNYQSPFYVTVNAFPYSAAPAIPNGAVQLQKIEPLFTIDLNLEYTIPDGIFPVPGAGGAQLGVTVTNLLDTDPPFQDTASGFGPGSQIGRIVAVSVKKKF